MNLREIRRSKLFIVTHSSSLKQVHYKQMLALGCSGQMKVLEVTSSRVVCALALFTRHLR